MNLSYSWYPPWNNKVLIGYCKVWKKNMLWISNYDEIKFRNWHVNPFSPKKSRLHLMPEGKHNLHLRYADEFNKLVEDFLEDWVIN